MVYVTNTSLCSRRGSLADLTGVLQFFTRGLRRSGAVRIDSRSCNLCAHPRKAQGLQLHLFKAPGLLPKTFPSLYHRQRSAIAGACLFMIDLLLLLMQDPGNNTFSDYYLRKNYPCVKTHGNKDSIGVRHLQTGQEKTCGLTFIPDNSIIQDYTIIKNTKRGIGSEIPDGQRLMAQKVDAWYGCVNFIQSFIKNYSVDVASGKKVCVKYLALLYNEIIYCSVSICFKTSSNIFISSSISLNSSDETSGLGHARSIPFLIFISSLISFVVLNMALILFGFHPTILIPPSYFYRKHTYLIFHIWIPSYFVPPYNPNTQCF